VNKPDGSGPNSSRSVPAFTVAGVPILIDGSEFLSLRCAWKAAGGRPADSPDRYFRDGRCTRFLISAAGRESVPQEKLYRRNPADAPDIWAHWRVAFDYAAWISDRFKMEMQDAARAWLEERLDPGLKMDRAIEGMRRQGMTDEQIEDRLKGKVKRLGLTSTMKSFGAEKDTYIQVTELANVAVTGMTARQIKEARNTSETRNSFEKIEHKGMDLFETATEQGIRTHGAVGHVAQVGVAKTVFGYVKEMMDSLRRFIDPNKHDGRSHGERAS
jgi:hypothetical protein